MTGTKKESASRESVLIDDEYARMIRENQRMVDLLERVVAVSAGGNPIDNNSGLMMAIRDTVDKVKYPLVSTAGDGSYTKAMKLVGQQEPFTLCGIKVIVSPNVPSNELWLVDRNYTKLLHILKTHMEPDE